LQRQFLAFLRKTPRTMLRDISFERARHELLQGSPGARVMDVALRSGFPHCGRFSVEYRRRYGETPSQTLKRQAFFVGAPGSLRAAEIDHALRKPRTDLSADDFALRAMPGVLSLDAEGKCPCARTAAPRDGAGSHARTGDGACRLGSHSAGGLSLHRRAAAGA